MNLVTIGLMYLMLRNAGGQTAQPTWPTPKSPPPRKPKPALPPPNPPAPSAAPRPKAAVRARKPAAPRKPAAAPRPAPRPKRSSAPRRPVTEHRAEVVDPPFPASAPDAAEHAPTLDMTHSDASPPDTSATTVVTHDDPANAAAWVLDQATTNRSWNFGTKARPNGELAKAQADMGGLNPDGIYGPKTRARVKALVGRDPGPRR
jgi:hypothetical protein